MIGLRLRRGSLDRLLERGHPSRVRRARMPLQAEATNGRLALARRVRRDRPRSRIAMARSNPPGRTRSRGRAPRAEARIPISAIRAPPRRASRRRIPRSARQGQPGGEDCRLRSHPQVTAECIPERHSCAVVDRSRTGRGMVRLPRRRFVRPGELPGMAGKQATPDTPPEGVLVISHPPGPQVVTAVNPLRYPSRLGNSLPSRYHARSHTSPRKA
jgi:hypothetical protein